jgi:hypothetical protein
MSVARVVALVLLGAGCRVELGAVPDAGPCAPSPRYFVSDFWLRYVDANQCATAGCHAQSGGHGYLRYAPPGNAPAATDPFDTWPAAWRANYFESVQLVRCDDPTASRLLTVPEGRADPHPPGDSIDDHAAAEQIFRDWIAAP